MTTALSVPLPRSQDTASALSDRAGGDPAAGRVRRPYLVALPDPEPPFDDELEGRADAPGPPTRYRRWTPPAPADAGSATTALLPARVPATREPVRIQVADVPAWSHEADMGVRRTSTAALPIARRSASMLARALVEVLSGQRSVAQLRVHCSADVYAGLAARPTPSSPALAHLLSVRVCEPADGVAEVSTVFRRGGRARAVAFRLQGVDGRWRITALQVG
ncbi:hypothetical protein JL107_11090 [Nakamurella flavida]|uniref:Uncharacterized protein n=1 Tax=Nakamurella flavida TaxID=363630 RepID=A0A938YPS9_9ACTN|nr:Rv3235 family protein [Nakamurella flavida]MBM9476993.1 hypothetical protein [Nakamurella flavida]MDP9779938.1 hypothetical protein [Nakamurella flavida]